MKLMFIFLICFLAQIASAKVLVHRLASRGGLDYYSVQNFTKNQSVEISVDYYKYRGCIATRIYSLKERTDHVKEVSISSPPIGRRCSVRDLRTIQNGIQFTILPNDNKVVDGVIALPQDSVFRARPVR